MRFCQWLNSFIQCSYYYCCYDWFDCAPPPHLPQSESVLDNKWSIFVVAVLGCSHCVCSPWPAAHYLLVPFYLLSYRPLKLIVSWGSWICVCASSFLCVYSLCMAPPSGSVWLSDQWGALSVLSFPSVRFSISPPPSRSRCCSLIVNMFSTRSYVC